MFHQPLLLTHRFPCRPDKYQGKRVLLVGLGNTGGDVAEALAGIASEVCIAHNHGVFIVSLLNSSLHLEFNPECGGLT
jgi:cation diffusion facilitator CzcD-associated flavoprotein CzcO